MVAGLDMKLSNIIPAYNEANASKPVFIISTALSEPMPGPTSNPK
jgi:hypothetical protein